MNKQQEEFSFDNKVNTQETINPQESSQLNTNNEIQRIPSPANNLNIEPQKKIIQSNNNVNCSQTEITNSNINNNSSLKGGIVKKKENANPPSSIDAIGIEKRASRRLAKKSKGSSLNFVKNIINKKQYPSENAVKIQKKHYPKKNKKKLLAMINQNMKVVAGGSKSKGKNPLKSRIKNKTSASVNLKDLGNYNSGKSKNNNAKGSLRGKGNLSSKKNTKSSSTFPNSSQKRNKSNYENKNCFGNSIHCDLLWNNQSLPGNSESGKYEKGCFVPLVSPDLGKYSTSNENNKTNSSNLTNITNITNYNNNYNINICNVNYNEVTNANSSKANNTTNTINTNNNNEDFLGQSQISNSANKRVGKYSKVRISNISNSNMADYQMLKDLLSKANSSQNNNVNSPSNQENNDITINNHKINSSSTNQSKNPCSAFAQEKTEKTINSDVCQLINKGNNKLSSNIIKTNSQNKPLDKGNSSKKKKSNIDKTNNNGGFNENSNNNSLRIHKSLNNEGKNERNLRRRSGEKSESELYTDDNKNNNSNSRKEISIQDNSKEKNKVKGEDDEDNNLEEEEKEEENEEEEEKEQEEEEEKEGEDDEEEVEDSASDEQGKYSGLTKSKPGQSSNNESNKNHKLRKHTASSSESKKSLLAGSLKSNDQDNKEDKDLKEKNNNLEKSKRRSRHEKLGRVYKCECGKSYLSDTALNNHKIVKHNYQSEKRGKGRPKKLDYPGSFSGIAFEKYNSVFFTNPIRVKSAFSLCRILMEERYLVKRFSECIYKYSSSEVYNNNALIMNADNSNNTNNANNIKFKTPLEQREVSNFKDKVSNLMITKTADKRIAKETLMISNNPQQTSLLNSSNNSNNMNCSLSETPIKENDQTQDHHNNNQQQPLEVCSNSVVNSSLVANTLMSIPPSSNKQKQNFEIKKHYSNLTNSASKKQSLSTVAATTANQNSQSKKHQGNSQQISQTQENEEIIKSKSLEFIKEFSLETYDKVQLTRIWLSVLFNRIYSYLRNIIFDQCIDFESTKIYISLLTHAFLDNSTPDFSQSEVKFAKPANDNNTGVETYNNGKLNPSKFFRENNINSSLNQIKSISNLKNCMITNPYNNLGGYYPDITTEQEDRNCKLTSNNDLQLDNIITNPVNINISPDNLIKNESLERNKASNSNNYKAKLTIDECFIEYLIFISQQTNVEYFNFAILYVILFREYLNKMYKKSISSKNNISTINNRKNSLCRNFINGNHTSITNLEMNCLGNIISNINGNLPIDSSQSAFIGGDTSYNFFELGDKDMKTANLNIDNLMSGNDQGNLLGCNNNNNHLLSNNSINLIPNNLNNDNNILNDLCGRNDNLMVIDDDMNRKSSRRNSLLIDNKINPAANNNTITSVSMDLSSPLIETLRGNSINSKGGLLGVGVSVDNELIKSRRNSNIEAFNNNINNSSKFNNSILKNLATPTNTTAALEDQFQAQNNSKNPVNNNIAGENTSCQQQSFIGNHDNNRNSIEISNYNNLNCDITNNIPLKTSSTVERTNKSVNTIQNTYSNGNGNNNNKLKSRNKTHDADLTVSKETNTTNSNSKDTTNKADEQNIITKNKIICTNFELSPYFKYNDQDNNNASLYIEYTADPKNSCNEIPLEFEKFISDYLEPKDFYNIDDPEEIVQLTQHFSYWLNSNGYSSYRAVLI